MNQLACFYCESLSALEHISTTEKFLDKVNRVRFSVYFPFENTEIEKQVAAVDSNPVKNQGDFLKLTGVIKAHECIVPFLVTKIISPDTFLGSRPSILADVQSFWFDDIDVWYNFPEAWVNFLRPLTPQAIFDNLSNDTDGI